ncbi:MAG: extracellular solute-binding protein [Polaromonas sp.]|nr:extracellular solute-binding protein [Polaromonas sp.]
MSNQLTRRHFVQTGAALAASAGLGAIVPARAQDDELYAAAKKEGKLSLYWGSYEQKTAEEFRDAFKAKYPGIEVSLLRQASQTVYNRLRLELQNGVAECDSLGTTNILHFIDLKKANALMAYEPRDARMLPAGVKNLDTDSTYTVGAISLTSINYQPAKVPRPPASWMALLEDQWQGKITIGSPAASGDVASWVVAMRTKFGDDFLRRLAKQRPKIGQSNVDTVTDILSGERLVGAAAPFSYTLAQKAAGNPIDVVAPTDDLILNLGVMGIPKNAPHPNAAKLYHSFLYSKEASQILAKNFWPTLRSDVAWAEGRSLDSIKWFRNKPDNLAAEAAEGIAKWKEIMR